MTSKRAKQIEARLTELGYTQPDTFQKRLVFVGGQWQLGWAIEVGYDWEWLGYTTQCVVNRLELEAYAQPEILRKKYGRVIKSKGN